MGRSRFTENKLVLSQFTGIKMCIQVLLAFVTVNGGSQWGLTVRRKKAINLTVRRKNFKIYPLAIK